MREPEPTGSHKKSENHPTLVCTQFMGPYLGTIRGFCRGNIGNCLLLPLLLLSVSILMNQGLRNAPKISLINSKFGYIIVEQVLAELLSPTQQWLTLHT